VTTSAAPLRSQLAEVGLIVLAVGLLGLGVGALVAPGWSSQTFGVPATEPTWVRATGMRDLVLGLALLALRSAPDAQRRLLPIILLLPVADAILVVHAGQSLASAAPHIGGIVAVGLLIVLGRNA
jgi:Mn2+/Fe2+ NRAMP family transporter